MRYERKKILVVDDEALIAITLRIVLSNEGAVEGGWPTFSTGGAPALPPDPSGRIGPPPDIACFPVLGRSEFEWAAPEDRLRPSNWSNAKFFSA